MGCLSGVLNVMVTICSSMFDVGSDFINSLDLLGYNASTTIASTVVGTTNDTEEFVAHQMWGYVGLGIMWLPGWLVLPIFILWSFSARRCFFFIVGICLFATYPLAMIVIEMAFLIQTCYKREINKSGKQFIMLLLISIEASYESFPQMVLQGYTIMYGYDVTKIQIVTIVTSFLLLSKTAITYDITATGKDLNFCQTIIHILKSIPIYCSTIVFRVLSFTLTIAYLRIYAVLPIIILFLELGIVSYIRYRNQEFGSELQMWQSIYGATLSNGGVLSINSFKEVDDANDEKDTSENVEANRKFIQLSSITTFLHHTSVLIIILNGVLLINPEYLNDEKFKYLILKPDNQLFYWAFGVTILIGLTSMVLSVIFASKMVITEAGDQELGEGGPGESGIELEEKFINPSTRQQDG